MSPWPLSRDDVARVVRETVRRYLDHDLMSYASAVAFRVLYALVPLTLAAIALLGFIGLEQTWTDGLAPDVRANVDDDLYGVIDETVRRILTERQGAWLTFGLLFALWQVSSAVRTVSNPLNAIYGVEEERSTARRLTASIGIAAALLPLLVLAILSVALGDRLPDLLDVGGLAELLTNVVRWTLTVVILFPVVGLLLRAAPNRQRPWAWNGVGSLLVVGSWTAVSLVFAVYLGRIADYDSIFGGLASVVVLLAYLYLLALTFFAGVQVDDVLRDLAEDEDEADPRLRDPGPSRGAASSASRPASSSGSAR